MMKGIEGKELDKRTEEIMQLIFDVMETPHIPEEDIKSNVIDILKSGSGIISAELIIKTNEVMMLIRDYLNPPELSEGDVEKKISEVLEKKSGAKFKIINKQGMIVKRLNFETFEQVDDYMINLGYDTKDCFIFQDIFGAYD